MDSATVRPTIATQTGRNPFGTSEPGNVLYSRWQGVNRVAKLYTRNGDDGWTTLSDGTKVRKNDERVEAYGTIDELNSHLGLAASSVGSAARSTPTEEAWATLQDRLVQIQRELCALGAELATPPDARNRDKVPATTPEQVACLERWIDEATAPLPPLRTFALPGGHVAAAQLHVCRTVCRRAERCVAALAEEAPINPQILVYVNRLSDLLFAWARLVNHFAGSTDVPWSNPNG
ncbi:MAG: cob(I)yrinic acid a,c-diamide adenosyltransferase [Phycisphaerae bacterium]|nr:cob(I)yrinic acid a,c-diamide adenosyltransferase [Phycisphaerae bacterium]